jgi:hypothetical protein
MWIWMRMLSRLVRNSFRSGVMRGRTPAPNCILKMGHSLSVTHQIRFMMSSSKILRILGISKTMERLRLCRRESCTKKITFVSCIGFSNPMVLSIFRYVDRDARRLLISSSRYSLTICFLNLPQGGVFLCPFFARGNHRLEKTHGSLRF